MARHDRIYRCKNGKLNLNVLSFSTVNNKKTKGTNPLTHLRAEAVSDVACLDMTSIKALVVSENLEMSTGVGTLGDTRDSIQMRNISRGVESVLT